MALVAAGRGARAQQAALGADDARRLHRRRGADRHGGGRPGRQRGGRGSRSRASAPTCSSCCPAPPRSSGVRGGFGSASTLTVADAEAIRSEDPAVAAVGYLDRQVAQVQYGNQNWSTSIQGVTAELSRRSATGRWRRARPMTEEDERDAPRLPARPDRARRTCSASAQNPVGATILVKSVPMRGDRRARTPRASPASGRTRTTWC